MSDQDQVEENGKEYELRLEEKDVLFFEEELVITRKLCFTGSSFRVNFPPKILKLGFKKGDLLLIRINQSRIRIERIIYNGGEK